MKKTRFVLNSIALGLSVLSTSFVAQATLPSFVSEQNSLAPMLEKYNLPLSLFPLKEKLK